MNNIRGNEDVQRRNRMIGAAIIPMILEPAILSPPPAPSISGDYSGDFKMVDINVTSAVPGGNPGGVYQLYGNFHGLLASAPVSTPNPVFQTVTWSADNNVWVVEQGGGATYRGDSHISNKTITGYSQPS